jgi:hydrophobe/amphiphile efflux-3 (HAE3) family protein
MGAFWRRAGKVLSTKSAIVGAVVVAITAVMAVGLGRLDFATGQDSYLEPTSTIAQDNERYQELFGGEQMVVMLRMQEGKRVDELFTPANLAAFDEVAERLRASEEIASVVTPATVLQWSLDLATSGVASGILADAVARETDPAKAELRQADAALTAARAAAAGNPSLENPEWIKFLVYTNEGFTVADDGTLVAPADDDRVIRRSLLSFVPNQTHAIVAAILKGNATLDELSAGEEAVRSALEGVTFEGAEIVITGTPTFLTDINDYLQQGMLVLGAIAVGVMVVILLVAFRVRWRLLPLLAMLVGVVWGFGAFGFTGTDLSLVTIAGLPILIGMGIEFAIQVHNRVEEECTVDHDRSPFAETMEHLGSPLVVATVAAVIAFLCIRVSRVPMVQDFGVLLAIGIVMLLVTGIVVPLAVLGARERRSPSTLAPKVGLIERFVRWLGSLPKAAVVPLAVLAIVIPVVGLFLEGESEIESDPINWADQSSQTIVDARALEDETGFASTLGTFVETTGDEANGVFTDQMGAFVAGIAARAQAENPELVAASSLAGTIADLTTVPGASDLPPTGLAMLQAFEMAPPDVQRLLVADDGNSTQVVYQVGPSSLEERSIVVDNLQADIVDPGDGAPLPANASATPAGLAVVGVGLLENITANRALLTIVAVVLVAAWLLLRHGSLTRAVLTMIPVLLAVGGSATLVALLDITLSPLTTVSGPLVVATCAEFSVLLIDRYREERRRGLDPDEATTVASHRTGRAFFTSGLTTLGGFAVIIFSSLPLLRDFGLVVTLNIAVAVASALVVVPPLVRFADARGWLPDFLPETAAEGRAVRWSIAGATGALLLALGAVLVLGAGESGVEAEAATPVTVPATDQPATLPPPTTAGATTVPTTLAPGVTLPPGPAEPPTGLVAGAFYDGLVSAGVDPGVARCAADNLLSKKSEPDLLAAGVALTPRPPEIDALLAQSAGECGVTPEQLLAAGG